MAKSLVIVESPAKMKTLKKFLGAKFTLASSVGHIRDLPAKGFGIDVENDFEPEYATLPEKKDVIKKLKQASKNVDTIYLAPDPDREGEAIAWHIAAILPSKKKIKRITFHSITKAEVLKAIETPREINQALVDAQQARRLLDRIVGYKISPILTRKVRRGKSGTSAGRVQSVALKLVVDREKEIDAFIPTEYWNIKAFLRTGPDEKPFEASLHSVDGKKVEKEGSKKKNIFLIPNEKTAIQIVDKLKVAKFTVSKIDRKEKKRNPVPPFITSTMQQEASRYFGFNASRTMGIAQSLYEGVDLGDDGVGGLITYMRTDSVNVAKEALSQARSHIEKHFGKKFLPDTPVFYKSKKSAQEAHEAIRPTNLSHPPEFVKPHLNPDQYKLYVLIWKRFLASQMKPAIYDTVSCDIGTDKKLSLRATGSTMKFKGFLAVYEEKNDENTKEQDKLLPPLKDKMPLTLKNTTCAQSFTKPPARYTEASLVRELEKSGIGRPSTYATIMNKIQSRDYTTKVSGALQPTDLGKIIAQMLEENFKTIMDVGFTAKMEDDLELIAENKKEWKEIIRKFWKSFIPQVEKAEKEATVPKILTDIDCPKCGHKLQKIWSKNKYFYGCSNYPDCPYTTALESLNFNKADYAEDFDWDQKCPQCESDMTLRHGRYGAFLGCSRYPDCKGIVNIPKKGEEIIDQKNMPSCPAVGCNGKIMPRKSRFGKIFYSCSNFPDCNVIVNQLDDLESKYKDHPKTAYVKKAGKKKGFSSTYKLSKELQKVLGKKELSRADVLKKIWVYIKKHKLQDPKNKRMIKPNQDLSKVFGSKDAIDMMQLSRILSKHMIK